MEFVDALQTDEMRFVAAFMAVGIFFTTYLTVISPLRMIQYLWDPNFEAPDEA